MMFQMSSILLRCHIKHRVEIAYPCIQLARRISEDGFRVIMSGEGSDELWASYGMSYHGIVEQGWRNYRTWIVWFTTPERTLHDVIKSS